MNLDLYQILTLLLSLFSGLFTLLLYLDVLNKLPHNKVRIYGEKLINKQKEKIKLKLEKGYLVYDDEYKGGKARIFPQLIIEKLDHRRMDLEPESRKYKKMVTHFVEENKIRMVKVWYIK